MSEKKKSNKENQNYWEDRTLNNYKILINKSEKYLNKELSSYYTEASKDIEKDIKEFYEKYATEEGLSLQEAKKILKNTDIIDSSSKNFVKTKYQIQRLELLQMQIDARVSKLYDDVQLNIYDYLYKAYEENYFKIYLDLKEIDIHISLLNTRAIDSAILSDWSGKNFSERIWKHKDKLDKKLKEYITNGLIRGESVQKISRNIKNSLKVSTRNAKRLVRTESNFLFNQSTIDGFLASGVVDRYQFLATLDDRTSETCIDLDSLDFKLIDATIGVNCPPMHPNCRSAVVAFFDDEKLSEKSRRAKDTDGNYSLVSADTSYKDWKNEGVK